MANAVDMTTAATVAAELRAPANDTRLPRLITAASRALATHLGYAVHRREGVVEKPASVEGPYLFLRAGQVTAVESIVVYGTTLDAEEYAIDSALMGRIVGRKVGFPFTGTYSGGVASFPLQAHDTGDIVVTFDAGWVTPGQKALDNSLSVDLPEDLEEAAVQMVTALYRRGGQDADVLSKSLGDGSVSYGAKRAVPATAQLLLAPYRKPTRRLF